MAEEKEKSLLVLTSGGDAPGMNTALRSVVRCWLAQDASPDEKDGKAVYAVRKGYNGLVEGKKLKLDHERVAGIANRGGTLIGAGRCEKLKDKESEERKKMNAYINTLKPGIEACIVIGGNGSFAGMVDILEIECQLHTVGIPATIDNDIWGTDLSLGVDTALNTAVEIIDKIRDTAAAFGRSFIVELMGRDCGFLALAAAIATEAEVVLIPEEEISIPDLQKLQEKLNFLKDKNINDALIIVAEGSKLKSQTIQNLLEIYTKGEVRKVVPGYTIRGGNPSAIDRILGCRFGYKAVELLEGIDSSKNESSQIVTLKGTRIESIGKVKEVLKKSGDKAQEDNPICTELSEIQKSLSKYHEADAKSGALLVIHGPDAPGINAAIRAFTRTALDVDMLAKDAKKFRTIAVRDGFKGLAFPEPADFNKNLVELDWQNTSRTIRAGGVPVMREVDPMQQPIHASKKGWLEEMTIQQAVVRMNENITNYNNERSSPHAHEANDIEILVVIGGRDAIEWIEQILDNNFSFPIIFIPASIDNDLCYTDYSIGFDTAVNNAVKAMDNIKETALAEGRVFLIETMGGLSGFLPLTIGLASGAENIFIPELFPKGGPPKDDILNTIKETILKRFGSKGNKTQSIFVLHECVVQALGGLEPMAETISGFCKTECSFEVRKTILDYTLRGGSPSAFDRILATRFGAKAAQSIHEILKENENYKDKKSYGVALRNNKIEKIPFPLTESTGNQIDNRREKMIEFAKIHSRLSKDEWMKDNLDKIKLFPEVTQYKPGLKNNELWEKYWKARQ